MRRLNNVKIILFHEYEIAAFDLYAKEIILKSDVNRLEILEAEREENKPCKNKKEVVLRYNYSGDNEMIFDYIKRERNEDTLLGSL